jgi:hypothetical protein
MTILVLLRQRDMRDVGTADTGAILLRCAATHGSPLVSRCASWLALSCAPLPPDAWTPWRHALVPIWSHTAQWPGTRADSREPRDRLHDLLLAANTAVSPADGAQIHAGVGPYTTGPASDYHAPGKLPLQRLAAWSLAWRSAPDPVAYVRQHACHPRHLLPDGSPMLWALAGTPYGRAFLARSSPPTLPEPPPAALEQLRQLAAGSPERAQRLLSLGSNFPLWSMPWQMTQDEWSALPSLHDRYVRLAYDHTLRGIVTTAREQWLRSCLIPTMTAGRLSSVALGQAAVVTAVSGVSTPTLQNIWNTQPLDAARPWDDCTSALLLTEPQSTRVSAAVAAFRADPHPAAPACAWLLSTLAGRPTEPWPAASWPHILTHPSARQILEQLVIHVPAMAPHAEQLRDPRCLLGFSAASLERPSETAEGDLALYLLGVLDAAAHFRQAGSSPRMPDVAKPAAP